MWRKRPQEKTDPKIAARVAKMPAAELTSWADQAIYSAGRHLSAYHRDPRPEYLEEARMSAEVLLEIVRRMSTAG